MGAARGAAADDDEGAAIKGGNRSFPYPHGLKASGNKHNYRRYIRGEGIIKPAGLGGLTPINISLYPSVESWWRSDGVRRRPTKALADPHLS